MYRWEEKWVFNNIVHFTVPTSPQPSGGKMAACPNTPLPAGYEVTAAGLPYPKNPPYRPADQYNPHYIGNFIRAVAKDERTSAQQKKCVATVAGNHLISNSTTKVVDGVKSRWYPYGFKFSANPGISELKPTWYSGLAQANALTLSLIMEDLTGEKKWRQYGEETLESYFVDISKGGFTSRRDGFLWFEEYPTNPPTTVLNGHFQAMIGLAIWGQRTGDQRALTLLQEAVEDIEPLLKASEVEVEGGVVATYDLVRGYPAAPLRIVPSSSDFSVTSATLNGDQLALPVGSSAGSKAPNLLRNGNLGAVSNGVPKDWRLFGSSKLVKATGGAVQITTKVGEWQGIGQRIAAKYFTPGTRVRLSLRGRVTLPPGKPGEAGKVAAYERCKNRTNLLFNTSKIRGSSWTSYDMEFDAPRQGCDLEIQLTSGTLKTGGTRIEYDDVSVSLADTVGNSVVPKYDLLVHRTPTNTVDIEGSGTGRLQAHADGRWQDVSTFELTQETGASIVIPERFTGRNIHYGYHENHIIELAALHYRTKNPMFLRYAQDWAPLAVTQHHTVGRPNARSMPTESPGIDGRDDVLDAVTPPVDEETHVPPPLDDE